MSRDAAAALERLYRRHRADVYRYALSAVRDREEAEDVTQAAFLNAYRALQRGGEPRAPRAWLLTIAENVRRRRLRTSRDLVSLDAVDEPIAREPAIDAEEIRLALERLPEQQRAALVLRELAGLSYAEIAEALGVSVASVQMLVFRGRRTLRAELGEPTRRPGLLAWPAWIHTLGATPAPRVLAVAAAGAAALVLPASEPVDRLQGKDGTGVAPRVVVATRAAPAGATAGTAAAAGARVPPWKPTSQASTAREAAAAPGTATTAPEQAGAGTAGDGAGASSPALLAPLAPSPPALPQAPQVEVPALPDPSTALDPVVDELSRSAPLVQPSPPSRSTTTEGAPLVETESPVPPILSLP